MFLSVLNFYYLTLSGLIWKKLLIFIVKKAQNRDKSAETELFEKLFVRFSPIAKQRFKTDYSEDIAQDACLTILE